jgi:hypothetical protein
MDTDTFNTIVDNIPEFKMISVDYIDTICFIFNNGDGYYTIRLVTIDRTREYIKIKRTLKEFFENFNREHDVVRILNHDNEKIWPPPPIIPVLDTILPSDEECSICQEPLLSLDVCGNMKCTHFYHCECITKWMDTNKSTCPICRAHLQLFKVDDSRRYDFDVDTFSFGKRMSINMDIKYLRSIKTK